MMLHNQNSKAGEYRKQGIKLKGNLRFIEALERFQKALKIDREAGPLKDVALDLSEVAECHRILSQYKESENAFIEAIETLEKVDCIKSSLYAESVHNLAELYVKMGHHKKAKPLYKKSLDLTKILHGFDHINVAYVLNSIGELYFYDDNYATAEKHFKKALKIVNNADGSDLQSAILGNLAEVYRALGKYNEAEAHYEMACKIAKKSLGVKHPDYALLLNNLAAFYNDRCRYTDAIRFYEESLQMTKNVYGGKHPDYARTLNNIALLYVETGRYMSAESRYKEALNIVGKKFADHHPEVAETLNNLGALYFHMRRYNDAEPLLKRALNIDKKIYGQDHSNVATQLGNMGKLYIAMNCHAKAKPLLKKALKITKNVFGANHPDTARQMSYLAVLYVHEKRYASAKKIFLDALCIAERYDDSNQVYNIQYGLSILYQRKKYLDAAIFYAKKAVNTIQDIRKNISKLGKDVLQSHRSVVEEIFNHLAGLLIEEGRFSEAEQVMNLLKAHEYFEYIRRDITYTNEFLVKVAFTSAETLCDKLYRNSANKLVELMRGQEASDARSQTLQLDGKLETAKKEFQTTIDHICKILTDAPKEQRIIHGDEESSELMKILKELGNDAIALYPFSTEETFHLLLVTNETRREIHRYAIRESELRKKISDFRQALILKGGKYDPQALAQELYRIVLGQSADELRNLKAKTLLWSLEGSLRYIPIAALHDGEKYLVESFSNVMFTPASKSRLKDNPQTIWKGLGLGVTKDYPPFAALPEVEKELKGIISSQDAGNFIFGGTMKLDENFTWKSMCAELKKKYPLVHIASHFQCTPGNDTTSFLLLGDGQRLTMDKIRSKDKLFNGVDLLTLSACNTAVGNVGQDGKEVECFGVLAQRQGAKAIIASLWPVADVSTSLLMKEFYKQRVAGKTKAEALQEAQLALLHGRIMPENNATTIAKSSSTRANAYDQNSPATNLELFDFESDEDKPFAHPYFWAPFILIGNWK